MVSKGSSTKGSSQALDYIMHDKENGKAVELDRNLIAGENGKEIISEFREVQEQNSRCVKNTYSIIISPSNEKTFSNEELKEIGKDHLKNLKLDNHQYLMTVHRSTDQPHIHIIANRIDLDGKAHNDQFISKKCQESAERIAKERGLTTAKEIQQLKVHELKPIKKEIEQAHQFSKTKASDFSQYRGYMQSKGIEVKPTLNRNQEMQGFKFYHKQSGLEFKASEVSKNTGVKDLLQSRVKMDIPLSLVYQNMQKEKGLNYGRNQGMELSR